LPAIEKKIQDRDHRPLCQPSRLQNQQQQQLMPRQKNIFWLHLKKTYFCKVNAVHYALAGSNNWQGHFTVFVAMHRKQSLAASSQANSGNARHRRDVGPLN
jgi:hypothetical protein